MTGSTVLPQTVFAVEDLVIGGWIALAIFLNSEEATCQAGDQFSFLCVGYISSYILVSLLSGLELLVWIVGRTGREVLILALVNGYGRGLLYLVYLLPLFFWVTALFAEEELPDHFVLTFTTYNVIVHILGASHTVVDQGYGSSSHARTSIVLTSIFSATLIQSVLLLNEKYLMDPYEPEI